MHHEVGNHIAFHIDGRGERHAEARPPTAYIFLVRIVGEDIGFQRAEAFLAHFAPDGFNAIQIGDSWRVMRGVIDPPSRAVGPIHADAIANLAAEQFIHRHAQPLRLRIEQRVLDRPQGKCDDATRRRAGRAIQLGIDALVLADRLADNARCKPLNDRAHARRAEAFIEFAPAYDAAIGAELNVVIVAPARVAGKRFDIRDLHEFLRDCVERSSAFNLRRIKSYDD